MKKSNQIAPEESGRALVIFTGDNLFSYILCDSICRNHKVEDIVVSHGTTHSFEKISAIFRKTSSQYFLYRVIIQLLSRFTRVSNLAALYDIKMRTVSNKSDFDSFSTMNHFMGIACNFDLIIPDSYIKSREGAVLNVHASDLPLDRGISPVVWAFCRGDSKIYISYYLMDGGIDTGKIVKKDVFEIDRDWSLFRAYCEVILYAASSLDSVIDEVNHNIGISTTEINHEEKRESYNSWPSKELNLVMKKKGKKYFKIRDISYINNLIQEIRSGRRLTKL